MGVLLVCAQDRQCIQGRVSRQTQSRPGGGIRVHIFWGQRPTFQEWSGIAMVAGGVLLLAFISARW